MTCSWVTASPYSQLGTFICFQAFIILTYLHLLWLTFLFATISLTLWCICLWGWIKAHMLLLYRPVLHEMICFTYRISHVYPLSDKQHQVVYNCEFNSPNKIFNYHYFKVWSIGSSTIEIGHLMVVQCCWISVQYTIFITSHDNIKHEFGLQQFHTANKRSYMWSMKSNPNTIGMSQLRMDN